MPAVHFYFVTSGLPPDLSTCSASLGQDLLLCLTNYIVFTEFILIEKQSSSIEVEDTELKRENGVRH
jgi:hypothetical protein